MPKTRKTAFSKNEPCIQSLMKLIETQNKNTLVNWAADYSEKVILPIWQNAYPDDLRPQNAIKAAREWLSGSIKLPQAKLQILRCHAAAREAVMNPAAQAAARGMGHSASAIHSTQHCIGLAFYGSLAVAYSRLGTDALWEDIMQCAAEECGHMEAALRIAAAENKTDPV